MIGHAGYYSNYHIGYRRPRRGYYLRLAFWISALVVIALVTISVLNMFVPKDSKSINIISPLSENSVLETLGVNIIEKERTAIPEIVENNLKDKNGTYAIGILNLKTGEEFFKNKHHVFESASLYKLWVMGYVYKRIENGTLRENAVLSDTIENLNNKFGIDQETAERKEGGIELTVENAVNLMISRSDNYSALLLSSSVGLSNVQNYLKEYSLNDSKVGTSTSNPVTSANDTLQFFYKLYYGELASEDYTQKMVLTLKRQTLNEKIPKYLPENLPIAHKTGELGTYSHDGGIVYTENGDYIIVILSDTNSRKTADETIGQISKEIYQYFTNE